MSCEYCSGGKDLSTLDGVEVAVFDKGPSLYVASHGEMAVREVHYCPMCGEPLYGVPRGNRVVYIDCMSYNTAKRWAPWAARIARRDGTRGCMAFESIDDYDLWVKNGRVYGPVKKQEGRRRYVDCSDEKFVKSLAPWATKVIPVGEGFLAFEREDDFRRWWAQMAY